MDAKFAEMRNRVAIEGIRLLLVVENHARPLVTRNIHDFKPCLW